jgi:hypothetical protein
MGTMRADPSVGDQAVLPGGLWWFACHVLPETVGSCLEVRSKDP